MHVLYLSHTGMSEPLGRSQVLPYLRGLARRGHSFDLISFEPSSSDPASLLELQRELAAVGIEHLALRRSADHHVSTKIAEASLALARSALSAVRRRPAIVHARSTLPSAVAAMLTSVFPSARMLFDCRGLIAEEYVDAKHWPARSWRYRITSRAESALLRRADGVVVLTERLRARLIETSAIAASASIAVIPCCVDAPRYRRDPLARRELRAELGIGDELVVAYSGTLGSWYCEEEMAALFAAIQRRRAARFLVMTRSPAAPLERALARAGVSADDVHVRAVAPDEMPRWLSAADVGLSLIAASPSKIASSPTKVAEYLASGLRVVMNRGVGDADAILDAEPLIVDAGDLRPDAIERAAERVATAAVVDPAASFALAQRRYDLEQVGVAGYAALYDTLARG